jgi:hypothetical protein
LGKLEVQRQLICGALCATAGLGNDEAATAMPVAAAAAVPPNTLRRSIMLVLPS